MPPRACCREAAARLSAISRACAISSKTTKRSPAPGATLRPVTFTGIEGPAVLCVVPGRNVSYIAFTRPYAGPQTTTSPTFKVPF